MKVLLHSFMACLFVASLAACGTGGTSDTDDARADAPLDVPADAPVDLPVDLPADLPADLPVDASVDLPPDAPGPEASLSVKVVSIAGALLTDVPVELGGVTVSTDATGVASFNDVALGRQVAKVLASGYAPSTAVVEIAVGVAATAVVHLLPAGAPLAFDAAAGATLVSGRVRLEIPANAIVDAAGDAVTGAVQVTVAGLDPASEQVVAAPGPFDGIPAGAYAPVGLISVFLAEISLSQGGAPVHLAAGRKATLEFALPEALQGAYAPGDTIAAWWYDLDSGLWRQDGTGTVKAGALAGAPLVWSVEVGHFTWWNADQASTADNCVVITVVTSADQAPVPGANVGAQGTYGADYGMADGDGKACVEFPRGVDTHVYVDGGLGFASALVKVEGWANAAGCDGTGDPCKQVTLTITPCAADGACDDGDACTTDACDLYAGTCVHVPLSCDDGDPCTVDSCNAAGACQYAPLCDDGNPCTVDSCAEEGCLYLPLAAEQCDPDDGCAAAADCDDGIPCTLEDCVAGACVATLDEGCGPSCSLSIECQAAATCFDAVCLPGFGCFQAPRSCDDGNACTADSCGAEGCVNTPIDGCACTDQDHAVCCGDDVCWVDSCGNVGAVKEDCGAGTCDPAVVACQAPCDPSVVCGGGDGVPARQCGPDGCGGVCGACSGDTPNCNQDTGMCQAGCTANDHKECCNVGMPLGATLPLAVANNAICWVDSCGVPGIMAQMCGGLLPGSSAVCLDPAGEAEPSCCTTACTSMDPTGPGAKCGVDDGCGGTCACPAGKTCNDATNLCVACTAQCAGKACGADDACGGTCAGTCPAGQACNASTHVCQCAPTCAADAVCGDSDGCGGRCAGACPSGQVCDGTSHVCEAFKTPCALFSECAALCGSNTGCLMACYQTYPGEVTKAQALGTCVQTACGANPTVECSTSAVSDGGSCKPEYDACFVCTPASCVGKQCGDAGCAVSCGTCDAGETCTTARMCCTPDCTDKVCGDDGCGGSCGTCDTGTCVNGACSACAPKVTVGCCSPGAGATGAAPSTGTSVCWVDSCGNVGDLVKTCSVSGCNNVEGLTCDGCFAQCITAEPCGDSGCGFDCGTCVAPKQCFTTEMGGKCQMGAF